MPNQPAPQPSPGPARSGNANAAAPPAARPASTRLKLRIAQLSDVGRARDHQEDAVGVFAPSDPALLARKGQLLIVADGMGGHNAGEVASQAAVAEIQRAYFAAAGDDVPANLRLALLTANQVIRQLSQGDASRLGMGTTAAVVVVRNREVQIANVGDSRVYLLRGATISQITQDHSWVEEQVRAGVLTPEQARTHPQRNVITRALGTGATVAPDLFNGALQEGDVLLLCSDGLSNLVSDAELLEIAGQAAPEQAARRLVDLANERGGGDNISVIVARAETPESAAAVVAPPPAAATRRLPVALLGAVALLLIAAGVVAVLLARGGTEETTTPTPAAPAASTVEGVAVATTAVTATLPAASAVVTPAVAITGTAAADLPPTATLIPMETPTATATLAAAATRPPTATRPAVRATATPVLAAGSLPPPQLSQPVDGFTALEGLGQEFSWQWTGAVSPANRFQIFMRRLGADDWEPVLTPVAVGSDGAGSQFVVVSDVPVVRAGGAGDYQWTVAVVSLAGARLSNFAAPRALVYRTGAAAPDTPAPPTRTPVPPTKTPAPPTNTPVPPTNTPVPPTDTPAPPTDTPTPEPPPT